MSVRDLSIFGFGALTERGRGRERERERIFWHFQYILLFIKELVTAFESAYVVQECFLACKRVSVGV